MAEFPAHLFQMAGDPSAIRSSAGKWSAFGTAATDAGGAITRLETGEFVGPEGDLFRKGLNDQMPGHLRTTGEAFGKVAGGLTTFAGTLASLQDRMRPVAQRAPALWDALQGAQGRVDRAKDADDQHAGQVADQPVDPAQPDTYRSDSAAAGTALSSARQAWQACVDEAGRLRGELRTAVQDCARIIGDAKGMRFKENPKWYDIGGQFTDFVRDNKELLQKLSGALKIVSLVAGLLSFIPVLAPIMGPIAIGSALLAGAIDLSIYAATGEGSLKTILIDIGLNLIPGVGKLARLGVGAMRGTKVALALSSVANRGRNLASVARWGLSAPRANAIQALKRLARLDPIDIASGAMILTQTDVDLPGLLPLTLTRTHVSSYRLGSWFGRSWASTLDQRIEVDDDGVYLATDDAMVLIYPPADPAGSVLPVEGPRWPLRRGDDGSYQVTDPWRGRTWHFAPATGLPAGQLPLVAVSDRNGNRFDIRHRDDGAPAEVLHAGGYRVRIHTERERIVALGLLAADDTETVLRRFTYDEHGDLTGVIDSSDLPQRFDYDIDGRIVRWTDRNGSSYAYRYDDEGRCVATTGPDGLLSGTVSYDPVRRVTTVVDSMGHATVYQINEQIQVESVTDPLGAVTRYHYDRYDRKLADVDPLGRQTGYRHDERGDLVEITRPDGTRRSITYNDLHLPTGMVDFDGGAWRWAYDQRGNVTEVTDPAGATSGYRHSAAGHLRAATDPLGATTLVDTDAAGLITRIVDPGGAVVTNTHDHAGRVTTSTDPLGGVSTFGSTVEGRPAWRRTPDGASEEWTYDPEGNLLSYTDQAGATTAFEYTHFELPVARIEPDGSRLTFGYDTELRLTSVTNQQGLVWRMEYDPVGRLTAETDFNGRTLRYHHDAAGQLVARTNGLGQTTTFTRDPLGRIGARHAPEGTTTFDYDPAGRLRTAVSPTTTLAVTRDLLGRMLTETVDGRTVSYRYDAAGRRVERRTPEGVVSRWEYGAGAAPTALHTAGHTLHATHDATGRLVRRELSTAAGVLSLRYTHDAVGRVLDQTLASVAMADSPDQGMPGPAPADGQARPGAGFARILAMRSYRYRADGRPTSVTTLADGRRDLGMDARGRVTAVTAAGWSEAYAYDAAGNLTDASWGATGVTGGPDGDTGRDEQADHVGALAYAGTLLRRAGRWRFEHDAEGRVTLRQRPRLSGKPLTWRYTWDSAGRLAAVTTPDGTRWTYRYDPTGRRIGKYRHAADGTVVERVEFTWDATRLAEQARHTPDGRRSTTTWEYDPDTHTPVVQTDRDRLAGAPQEEIDERFRLVVTDLVGTPTELVDPNGRVVWQARATIWGATTPVAAGANCPLRQPGQYHDPETGHHYNCQRYYDPATGRYLTMDPLGIAPGPNPGAYVDNPVVNSDPQGLGVYPLGKVSYGSTGASRIAVQFRRTVGAASGQNLAVYSVQLPNGKVANLVFANTVKGPHSEAIADDFLSAHGFSPSDVKAIYSERAFCTTAGHECAGRVAKYTDAALSWSFDKGENAWAGILNVVHGG